MEFERTEDFLGGEEMTERKWLTAPELAKETGLSRQMITQLCRLQKLPCHKICGRWLIDWGLMKAAMGLTGPHWGDKCSKSQAGPLGAGSEDVDE